ncbi:MAG: hypothetical protein K8S20_15370 [Chloroflexi bacterium]|nr:hypothetical protein [Chloroflexota bacterium]
MKNQIFPSIALLFLLSACDVWRVQPQPIPIWSPNPTQTPGIVTATPVIFTLPYTQTPGIVSIASFTPSLTSTPETPPSPIPTDTFSAPTASSTPTPILAVEILGCNTSIDISHGMGEVTNAYVLVKNTGSVDVSNACALLRAADEDREHPDKKACIPILPPLNQVTLKLTVDSAYKQDTSIQVDASSNDILLIRVDKSACTDIGLFGGVPTDLGIIKPIQP